MPVDKLKKFLDDQHVKYVTIKHSRSYTAQEVADSAHIAGREMAKTVMVKLGDRMAMAVLPAPDMVSIERLRAVTGVKDIEIATENEFSGSFPNCEVGAMPPFGNLWGMAVYVDERLREDERIAFNAGTHTELVQLAYSDFERLVQPTVAHISTRPE